MSHHKRHQKIKLGSIVKSISHDVAPVVKPVSHMVNKQFEGIQNISNHALDTVGNVSNSLALPLMIVGGAVAVYLITKKN
jgi:hypothetical protein